MKTLADILNKMDWGLLKEQKAWLLKKKSEKAQGLVCLIDALQDAVVEDGLFTERQIFDA